MSEQPPVDRRNLSHVPSWIMVGALLGVVATLGFQSDPRESEPAPAAAPDPVEALAEERNALAIEDQPSLSVIEALFEQYEEYALWENNVTQIAVWNTRTLGFTDYFEVTRTATGTYFRSIARPSRFVLEDYGPADSPLRFTESGAQRAARYRQERGLSLPSPPGAEEAPGMPSGEGF